MRELNVNEIKEVNGGFIASAAWIAYGAYRAYKAYRVVRFVAQASAGGSAWDAIKAIARH